MLHLALLAATIPLGPELAITAVSLGSAVTLAFVYRDRKISFHAAPGSHAKTDRAAEPSVTAAGSVAPTPVAPLAAPLPSAAPASIADADAAWTDIMGQISHELRTPLNAIIGFSDLMGHELHGPVGDPRYQEYLGHIRDSGRLLLKSAEDTLALTELLAGRRSSNATDVIDLEEFLAVAVRRVSGAAASTTAPVHFDRAAARGIDVEADYRALDQVLLNVMTEARERAGEAGALVIAVRDECGTAVIDIVAEATHVTAGTSLRLSLATMMIQLIGGSLQTSAAGSAAKPLWRATIRLDMVRQPDLFRH